MFSIGFLYFTFLDRMRNLSLNAIIFLLLVQILKRQSLAVCVIFCTAVWRWGSDFWRIIWSLFK